MQGKHTDVISNSCVMQLASSPSKGPAPGKKDWRIVGWRNEVNLQGLPVQNNLQFVGVFDRNEPSKNLLEGPDCKFQVL